MLSGDKPKSDKQKKVKLKRLPLTDESEGGLERSPLACMDIVQERAPLAYSQAEQQFSVFIQRKMLRLLRGDDDALMLMRRYYHAVKEVAFFMPPRLEKQQIRLQVAEAVVYGVLRFLDPFAPGGPIAQDTRSGRLIETQLFPTQYPHIVVERTDVFRKATGRCLYVEWRAVRLQNQRRSTLVNQALDLGSLALEIAKFFAV